MLFLDVLQEANSLVSFALSVPLNCVLVWLVLRHTPKQMQLYSRILLQTTLLDILLALIMELTQPVVFMQDGAIVLYLNGPLLQNIGSPFVRFLLFEAYWLFYNFAIFGLSIQFLYRYLVLVRDKTHISIEQYLAMLLVPVVAELGVSVLFYLCAMSTRENELIQSEKIAQILTPHKIYAAFYAKASSTMFMAALVVVMALDSLCYGLIYFCARRVVAHVREHTKEQPHSAELNRQLTRTLLIQATIPLLLLGINLFLIVVSLFFSSGADSLMPLEIVSCVPMHWLPLFNPLVTILTVQRYRRVVTCQKEKPPPKSHIALTRVKTVVAVGRHLRADI